MEAAESAATETTLFYARGDTEDHKRGRRAGPCPHHSPGRCGYAHWRGCQSLPDDLDLTNCAIYVRRGVVEGLGIEQSTKTENGERIIDIDPELADVLRQHLAGCTSGRVFQPRNGAPIHAGNLRNRMLHPLLDKLVDKFGIPRGGFHAFRHARVTILRKHGAPAELQTQWIGHSNLRMTDRYSHTDEEVEYRQRNAREVGLGFVIGPNGPKSDAKENVA
jgi:hypothetical protein